MMVSFLNEDTDLTGKKMYTSAYRDVDGKATTRVTGDVKLTGSTVVNNKLQVDVGGATFTGTIGDMQSKVLPVTLQNGASAIGNGIPFDVAAYKELTISITGNSASRTIVFEEGDADGNYTPIQGVRRSDLSLDTQTTGTAEVWNFSITGAKTFRARISTVSGVKESASLNVTAAATAAGNVTVNLNGVAKDVAVLATDLAADVATKIRGTAFTGWTTGGTGTTVTFTSTTDGNKTDATYSAGTTSAAGTMTTTTQGTSPSVTIKGQAVA